MAEELLVDQRGKVLTLAINRPEKMNSLSPEVLYRMGDILNGRKGDEVRAVVLRGAGRRAFSSGYDIGRIPSGGEDRAPNPLQYGLEAVANFPYPVIAMIFGHALGAGCHLAAVCDLRIAGEGAQLGMPPVKLGIVYPWEGYKLFLDLIGLAHTKELFLIGRPVSARGALEMGLVHRVVPDDQLEEGVYRLAEELAEENAPIPMKGSKFIINRLTRGSVAPEDEEAFRKWVARAFTSEDLKEARAAFAEKRKPRFIGR